MKKSLLIMLLTLGLSAQAANQNLWYSIAALASARVAEKSGHILSELGYAQRSPEFLKQYAEGVGFLSSLALIYYALQEAKN